MSNTATLSPAQSYPAVPYGQVSFKGIRQEDALYMDKTRFLHSLESHRYAFFLRPRRFGKTCWLSLLESYYGRHEAADFDAVFGGTAIGSEPTPNRSRHVVLRFDYRAIHSDLETLERDFEGYCGAVFAGTLKRHPDLFPSAVAERMCAEGTINNKLVALFQHCQHHGIPLYVLIDEYDNFANTTLAERGADAYRSFTHDGGFYHSFFAKLKYGTEIGSVDRIFVTGVSPMTMGDLSSGFNIATNISQLSEFNELLGFTEAEVHGLLEKYQDLGVFDQNIKDALHLMREWYGRYRFADNAETEVYNPHMVLYYLKHSLPNKPGPGRLIDSEVRMDFNWVLYLLRTEWRRSGKAERLEEIVGREPIDCNVAESFSQAALAWGENFHSLLHHFGLLSRQGAHAGCTRLNIPNLTVWNLLHRHPDDANDGRSCLREYLFRQLILRMALGRWRPFINALKDRACEQPDNWHGEETVRNFIAAYLGMARCFVVCSEADLGEGNADLVVVPLTACYPTLRHGFLIELRHLGRTAQGQSGIPALAEQAENRLRDYLTDRHWQEQHHGITFIGLALVFRGRELVHVTEVTAES